MEVIENYGYNLGYFQLPLARHTESPHSYPHSVASSDAKQKPAVSSLRKQQRRSYQYRCIFKDNNGQCQKRGKGPLEKVTRFLCEEHALQEEQENEKDEDYRDDGDEEDEEHEYGKEKDKGNKELDGGEYG